MTALEYAAALRRIADFYEQHQDFPLPILPDVEVCPDDTREEVVRIARVLGGYVTKEANGPLLVLVKDFGGVSLRVLFARSAVCERRIVGVRHVERRVVPAHDVEEIEWDCGSIFDQRDVQAPKMRDVQAPKMRDVQAPKMRRRAGAQDAGRAGAEDQESASK